MMTHLCSRFIYEGDRKVCEVCGAIYARERDVPGYHAEEKATAWQLVRSPFENERLCMSILAGMAREIITLPPSQRAKVFGHMLHRAIVGMKCAETIYKLRVSLYSELIVAQGADRRIA